MIRLLRSGSQFQVSQLRFLQRSLHSSPTRMMSDTIRTAKSDKDWTPKELDAYNIKIRSQNSASFFNTAALPEPTVNPEILTTLSADDTVTDDAWTLLIQLGCAMLPPKLGESAIEDFAVELFLALGYTRFRLIRTQKEIPLVMCGKRKSTTANVCVLDPKADKICLVVHDKHFGFNPFPFPQIVAKAIAAFQYNNSYNLRKDPGGVPLENTTIPGIILDGTSPTFVKVPVTTELVHCIERGEYPPTPTVVLRHIPDIPRPDRRVIEGMKPLDNRRIILQCYEAFKQFVV